MSASILNPMLPELAGERIDWRQLHGSARALAIVEAARRAEALLLVLTTDILSATRLQQAIDFYSGGEIEVGLLPGWETLPYDQFSPYQDIISERLSVLARLPGMGRGILLVPVQTAMHHLPPRDYIEAHSLYLRQGQTLERDAFRERLLRLGYQCVSQVMEHGDFAVRGSLIDVYPMGAEQPCRIDLFDNEIDSLRAFDPEDQRSTDPLDEIAMLPAREFPLNEEAIGLFRSNWRTRFEGRAMDCPVYRDVSEGLAPAGIEYYLPLFFTGVSDLFDYLPRRTLILLDAGIEAAADAFREELAGRYEQLRHDPDHPLLEPDALFLQTNEVFRGTARWPRIRIRGLLEEDSGKGHEFCCGVPPGMPVDARAEEPLALVRRFLDSLREQGGRALFVAESMGRRETLLELFRSHGLSLAQFDSWPDFVRADAPLGLAVGALDQGALLQQPRLAVISEAQLFGERAAQQRRRRRGRRDSENIVRNLTELRTGAPVVHVDHGVGRYQGLVTLVSGGLENEYLHLEYADGDKLYVPVGSLHLISRYTGVDPEHAPLHKLGSGQWLRARRRAAEKARDVAAELLDIYARREARKGHAFTVDEVAYQAFVQGFPFEETPDQEETISAVIRDMRAEQPMDRLVCGDVGFGKTEVAMRAAFIAAMGGRQVAMLVPTTLLAQQHYQNFVDRFADWPIRIASLSRFGGRKQQQQTIAGIAQGDVDIVIGTHKLLQEEIRFKQLGLLIIDEEHRFGVRQKERVKQLRSEVDILTLTATPIPRTLNLALSGTRELSIIATPPSRRLAIRTFVREWRDALLREAILREISRGGQVYFLHNEVETMPKMVESLRALVPEAKLESAHGQLRERELERVMLDFYHHRFNVLVCSTIIETGIDVPTANTIIINRADKFGLAQLYQLRGRVGRSHHRAYAYLIVPERRAISADAVKRLEAIESLEELGVGFTIATHDLEIRGAGEILGEEQSGQIQEIGFGLYTDMLARAVAALKAGREPELERPLDHGVEVDLHVPALFPEDYLPDVHTRLILYKRIASVTTVRELAELKEEVIDRFGLLPPPAVNLFRIAEVKLRALAIGVRKIDLGAEGGRCLFQAQAQIDPSALIQLIQRCPHVYRLEGGEKLRIMQHLPEPEDRIQALDELFDTISTKDAA